MTELLTAAQMRTIEQAAIDSGEVTGLELMERAGAGVVEAIFEEWPELAKTDHRAVVLCGPGNNGGDGFVVARLLKEWGWQVEVFLYGDEGKLPPDAKVNCQRWAELGTIQEYGNSKPIFAKHPDLFVDALFGIGLSRDLTGEVLDLSQSLEDGRPYWCEVAVDIPSGLNSDSGKIMGAAIPTELTVTFHRKKLGHHISQGPQYCGKVVVKDIGLSKWS